MPIKRFFENQVNDDQCKYSRYVCDSRAIPHEIDGLKPVQRRILWTMWNTTARNQFTKTVKVAGMVMAYHPHGDRSIQDALAAMAQEFPFANNHALVAGEGTFGDALDPQAIASPRYTEVKLSDFSKDVGLFESLDDIDYIANYDETDNEPVFFCAKIPLVLLNGIQGIATGFRCNIPPFRLQNIIDSMIFFLKTAKVRKLNPWVRGFLGPLRYEKNENNDFIFSSGFNLTQEGNAVFITDAPQSFNRERVVALLDRLLEEKADYLGGYTDHSRDRFRIELDIKRGKKSSQLHGITDVFNNEVTAYNMITVEGTLAEIMPEEVIRRFSLFRKKHLIRRFKRLSAIEEEKIKKNNELIRFIREGWNKKVTAIKSKSDLELTLKRAKFVYFEWLSAMPIYRLTLDEVDKCKKLIAEAKQQLSLFQHRVKDDSKLVQFMIEELRELKERYDP